MIAYQYHFFGSMGGYTDKISINYQDKFTTDKIFINQQDKCTKSLYFNIL